MDFLRSRVLTSYRLCRSVASSFFLTSTHMAHSNRPSLFLLPAHPLLRFFYLILEDLPNERISLETNNALKCLGEELSEEWVHDLRERWKKKR